MSTEAEIATCVTAIDDASCPSLDLLNGGMLPATCEGVVVSAAIAAPLRQVPATLPGVLFDRAGALMSR